MILESRCSINDLPVECMQKIISNLPGRHWPRLALVNQKFQNDVYTCWRSLKEMHLKEYSEKRLVEREVDAEKRSLQSILRMAQIGSPNVRMIDGFESFSCRLDTYIMERISKFKTLKSVTFSICAFCYNDLAPFLANPRSRCVLEELRITNSRIYPPRPGTDEEAIRRALIAMEGRPELRLKTFHFEPIIGSHPCGLLFALDVSKLENLSIIASYFGWSEVAEFLGRCTQLKELAIEVDSMLVTSSETILNGLKSLPSPDLRKLGLYAISCPVLRDESAVEALRALAQRCPRVEVLDIRGFNSDAMLSVIGRCVVNLKELHIDVHRFSKEAFAELMTRTGQLKKLGLHFLDSQNGARLVEGMIPAIAVNMDSLISLHLDSPLGLTNDAMSKLARMKLKELSIKFPRVDEGTIAMCGQLGPMMTSVDFGSAIISDRPLVDAIEKNTMSQLRRISLEDFSVTDRDLQAIGDSCPLLEELNIVNSNNVTATAIRGVIEKCKKLTRLKVHREIAGLRDVIRDTSVTIETQWC